MHRLVFAIALLCTILVALPAPAPAAEVRTAAKRANKPVVTLVAPMRATVGSTLAIRGRGFSRASRRNTIIFRSPSRRVSFAKPRRSFARKLVVRVPASVERLLRKQDGDQSKGLPTRIRLRVISKRRYGKLTILRRSPLIVSALRTGGQRGDGRRTGAPAACDGADFDDDLVSNAREAKLKTDPCRADTDGDGVEDGFEQESALDLNQRAVPYPGRRPFPNALDPTDAGNDYDGDGLTLGEEARAWARRAAGPFTTGLQAYTDSSAAPAFGGPYGGVPAFGNHASPMSYSDGRQATLAIGSGHPEYRGHLDGDGDGRLTDDERDADGDGLGNFTELRAQMVQGHYPAGKECGYEYRPYLPRNFADVDFLEADGDGDGISDGNDDQDNDGVSNVDESLPPYDYPGHPVYEPCGKIGLLPVDRARDGSLQRRHPFNPCLPYRSETCARFGVRE